MMSKKLFVALMVLLIVMVFWIVGLEEKPVVNKESTNLVSLREREHQEAVQEIKKQESQKQETSAELVIYQEQEQATSKESNKSYLSVYRQLKLAEACRQIYNVRSNGTEYEAWLIKRMESFSNDKSVLPPEKQFEQLDLMVTDCLKLKEATLGFQSNDKNLSDYKYGQLADEVVKAVRSQLDQTTPNSSKEKAIAKALKDIVDWRAILTNLLVTSQGEDTFTAEEIEAKKQQLETLKREVWKYVQNLNDPSVQARFQEINVAIVNIQEVLKNQKQVNETLRASQLLIFNQASDKLIQQLRSRDPDVFLEVIGALEFSRIPFTLSFNRVYGMKSYQSFNVSELLPEYVTPAEVMMAELGVKGNSWLEVNGDHLNRLYYCRLGGECGADELLARSLCLPLSYLPNPNACNKGVVSFMQNHLLSPNQWLDVQLLMEWMEARYGS